MSVDSALLAYSWPAMLPEVEPADPHELVIVRAGRARRRSSVYFLGLAHEGACRWVLKQPNSGSRQVDLQSPLSAAQQFESLQRLHRHLQQLDGHVGAPRPVAYLPEVDAYIMEYVPGPTVVELLGPGAVLRPGPLLRGVTDAAEVLQAVHSVEPAVSKVVDVATLRRKASRRAREVLESTGLPTAEDWFDAPVSPRTSTTSNVLLHGDFCPENVLLSPTGPVCLDPDLCARGWAEQDVVRFLVMMFDAPLFVTGSYVPAVQRLRRAAAEAFLTAYYGEEPWPQTLQPMMLMNVAERWATRHTDVRQRRPGRSHSREALLRQYFRMILDEVSSPTWPGPRR